METDNLGLKHYALIDHLRSDVKINCGQAVIVYVEEQDGWDTDRYHVKLMDGGHWKRLPSSVIIADTREELDQEIKAALEYTLTEAKRKLEDEKKRTQNTMEECERREITWLERIKLIEGLMTQ